MNEQQKVKLSHRGQLAALAHSQWSGWMRYLFSRCTPNEDGTMTIPKWAVDRWTRQMLAEYAELSDAEKHSDLQEADKVIELLINLKP